MQDVREPEPRKGSKQNMDVIGHYDPRMESIALAIEIQESIFNDLGNPCVLQPSASVPHIQISFDSSASL